MREQGEGLVVYDALRPEGTVVKASSIHPALTKAKLEGHVGKFMDAPQLPVLTAEVSASPIRMLSTYKPQFELRDKAVRFERRQERAEARFELKQRYKQYRESWIKPDLNVVQRQRTISEHFNATKAELKKKFKDPLMRKLMYRVAELERMKATAELRIQVRAERQSLPTKA